MDKFSTAARIAAIEATLVQIAAHLCENPAVNAAGDISDRLATEADELRGLEQTETADAVAALARWIKGAR